VLTVRLGRLGLTPGQRVLDLGCGEGRHVHGVHGLDGVHVVGVDLDETSLAKARAGLETLPPASGATLLLKGDALKLPFTDASFDAVICSEVLEHLLGYPLALAEISRVIKPGGHFVATVPRAWPERICWTLAPGAGGYADQPGGHVRIFDQAELRAAIAQEGFAYRGLHHAHALHSPYWWLKTAFWSRRDDHPLVRLYHRFLVWDLMKRPWFTRILERSLDPVLGKSVALYFLKAPGV
jgi:SAM-dependent methyltransferase